ncbi:hypothetical protein [Pseudonocardia yunnanensis]|uniref:Uncharacterized protein n=1 Tax=Pseudonocardia yunnanensis TaxID=58107 RepID=A0ABW4F7B0_9PSEU
MPIPNAADAPLLVTDADVLRRVTDLVGTAAVVRQLWMMFVDGDCRQSPVVMPISDIPEHPESGLLDGLAMVLSGLRDELTTDLGPGSVILTLERRGPDAVLPADREWRRALALTCDRAEMGLRGLFLSTDAAVRRIA